MKMPETLSWNGQTLRLLDQTLLPEREEYIDVTTPEQLEDCIRRLVVRVAPAMCRKIGEHGRDYILKLLKGRREAALMTHCNAGALATGGCGTALSVMYALQQSGVKLKVSADETRPLLQGARLTAWELSRAG